MHSWRLIFLGSALLLAGAAHAADAAAPAASAAAPLRVQGTVAEVQDTENYTYLRLTEGSSSTWVAVQHSHVVLGSKVSIDNPMEMINFESKALKRTFPRIIFGTIQGTGDAAASPHGSTAKLAGMDVKVAKATGAKAYTVAEVVKQADALNGKAVELHAKVVKFNPDIMGKNWVHVRDGSGKDSDGSNDILVTTADSTSVGATVTVSGTVRTKQDFGSGYAYKVLIDGATLKP